MQEATTRELRQAVKELAKYSREYKRLVSRSYRNYKKYPNYKEIALSIAGHLETIDLALSTGLKTYDPTWINISHAMFNLYQYPEFPVYALTEELFEAFINSEPPSKLWEMPKPFDRALIMLPKGKLKNPDGLNVDWLIVDFLDPENLKQELSKFIEYVKTKMSISDTVISEDLFAVDSTELRIRWSTIAEYQFSYTSIKAMPKPGKESQLPTEDFLTPQERDNEDREKQFTQRITGLVLLLLVFMTRPKFKHYIDTTAQTQGFQPTRKKRNDPKQPRNYITIGKDFTIKRTHQGGTHASPTPHFRRGFCRTLPWREPGDQEIWIPPTWVGGDN